MEDQNQTVANAAQVASQVASEAVNVAREVALEASRTASKVAELAGKTQETVLLFGNELGHIKTDIKEIKDMLENKYVTKEEFKPVRLIVLGLSSSIFLAVVGALMATILKK